MLGIKGTPTRSLVFLSMYGCLSPLTCSPVYVCTEIVRSLPPYFSHTLFRFCGHFKSLKLCDNQSKARPLTWCSARPLANCEPRGQKHGPHFPTPPLPHSLWLQNRTVPYFVFFGETRTEIHSQMLVHHQGTMNQQTVYERL